MAYTFLAMLLGAAAVVEFGLRLPARQNPLLFAVLAALAQLPLGLLWTTWLAPRLSPLRKLPLASQGPWWKTFLVEPPPDELEKFMNETPNDGLIRYFGVFHGERLLITKPQGTKEMMLLEAYNFNKLAVAKKIIGQLTGPGLVVVDQDEHKRQRKSLLPVFKFKYIKDLFPQFWIHTRKLVGALEKEIDSAGDRSSASGVVNVDGWLMRATLDIVAAAGFGVDIDAVHHPEGELARLLHLANSTSPQASFYRLLAFLVPDWLYVRLPMARRYEVDRIVKALRDATLPLIQSRRKALSEKDALDPDSEQDKSASQSSPQQFGQTDVISTLLRFPQPLGDDELVAQSASILAAGQDTTSVATTWALYLLAHHPHVQSTLRTEIQTHLPSPSSSDGSVDATLIESLPYLAAVCNETLRLYPPAPVLRRQVVKPGTVILGEHMPVGTVLLTSIWGTHHTQSIWGPDVHEFKPERFLRYTEDGQMKLDAHAGLHGEEATYSFLPFGAGVRSCIGERFARGEFAILVAGLVGKFEWSPVDPKARMGHDVELSFGIVTKPQGGLSLRARKLDDW